MNGISGRVQINYGIDFSTNIATNQDNSSKVTKVSTSPLDNLDKGSVSMPVSDKPQNAMMKGLSAPAVNSQNKEVGVKSSFAVDVVSAKDTSSSYPATRKEFELWQPYAKMSTVEKQELRDILDKEPKILPDLCRLIENKQLHNLSAGSRFAVLHGCRYYPDSRVIGNLEKMLDTSWFKMMEPDDARRAVKLVGTASEKAINAKNPQQKAIINNTINYLIDENINLAFESNFNLFGFMFGYSDAKKEVTINTAVATDNGFKNWFASLSALLQLSPGDSFNLDDRAIDTFAHEMNHVINRDEYGATYKYFQAEYRAYYTGFIAGNGRVPTRKEAYDRCLDILAAYPILKEAVNSKNVDGSPSTEARQIMNYLSMFAGVNFNFKDKDVVDKALNLRVTNRSKPAPIPDQQFKPNIDNSNGVKVIRDNLQASLKGVGDLERKTINSIVLSHENVLSTLKNIINSAGYQSLPLEHRMALLHGFKFAEGDTGEINNVAKLADLTWFKELTPSDARRSVVLINSLSKSQNDPELDNAAKEDNKYIANKLLDSNEGFIVQYYDDVSTLFDLYSVPEQFNKKKVLISRSLHDDIGLDDSSRPYFKLYDSSSIKDEIENRGLNSLLKQKYELTTSSRDGVSLMDLFNELPVEEQQEIMDMIEN